ncbi:MAG: DUF711 family protein [Edaphobacter sp.]|uniref:DUF711 family protein n=1 Tax=Edaphobacter sp. TaxID=1934404 RepID=UPI0023A03E3B|nr:DUF711 family protein [Edaphobacter sp.]MDE1178814.1 DUF711 family protein [Edaphobacter sp.]
MRGVAALLLVLCLGVGTSAGQPGAKLAPGAKPRVRAITAFVRLDREHYEKQVADALAVVRKAKAEFEAAGYEVETVRMTTQPLAELVQGMSEDEALKFLGAFDALAGKEHFAPNIGPAMMHDSDDMKTMHLLERVLSTLPRLRASAIIADEKEGIHWKTIRRSAELVKYVSEHSQRSEGTLNFAGAAMVKPMGPFFPASYHTGAGGQFGIGYESANVAQDVLAKDKGNVDLAIKDLTAALTTHALVAERIGNEVAKATGWSYVGLDATPAPMGDVSIAAAMESFTGAKFGSRGTMTAARVITTAVKAIPVKQTGYAGLMLPVMEDNVMSERWDEGTYTVDALLAYSSVCATGLDTVPLPGDVTVEQMEWMFRDVATLAYKWNKPLAVRLDPVAGKKAGERTEFEDSTLKNVVIRALP